jgi:hypothetical protein
LNRIIYGSSEKANIEKEISKINAHNIEPIDNSYDFLNNNFKAKELDLTNILSDKYARSEIKKDLNILLNSDFQYLNKERTIDELYKQLKDLNERDYIENQIIIMEIIHKVVLYIIVYSMMIVQQNY